MRLTPLVVAVVALLPLSARAQGLLEVRSDVPLPYSQAAAVDDATAALINPAGLGAVRGFELQGGWFTRSTVDGHRQVLDLIAAVNGPLGTLALGVGAADAFGTPKLRTTLAGGLQLDPNILVGGAMHSIGLNGGAGTTTFDLGTQLRFSRSIALGIVGEQLASEAASLRAGLSVRPIGELLTIGLDARLLPGDGDAGLLSSSIVPGLNARMRLGGLVLGLGAEARNIGSSTSPLDVTASGFVQFDFGHAGVTATGSGYGIGGNVIDTAGGGRVRFSTVPTASILAPSTRWLELALAPNGGERDDDDSIWDTLFGETPTAAWVLAALDNAADDKTVAGVVLRMEGLSMGFGRAAELRAAIVRLRAAGKKVAVHMVSGDDLDTWVASAADTVWLTPSGGLAVDGVRARMVYLADVMARFGVSAEAVSAGRYKSAPRTFTHSEPSAEELEVENALLDGAYNQLVAGIAEGRELSSDDVKAIIDLGGLSAQEALDKKLVDGLAYSDELPELLGVFAGLDPGKRLMTEQHFIEREQKNERWDVPPRIAIIPVEGTIQMGKGGGGFLGGDAGAGSDDVVEAIEAATEDDSVVAIVLRIDSPGGDALASDLMWRAAMKARDKKPVIASMGDVAASGGYYLASAANEILAESNTITGSIGVFGLMFNGESLANDLGVRSVELKRGARPGPDLLRGTTDAERERLQASVDGTYERFLDAVVAGRGTNRMTKDKLRTIAEGHVWTGAQALQHGLVDKEGSLVDALRLARERAGLAADAAVGLAVFSGDDEMPGLADLGGMVSVAMGMPRHEAMALAAKLLFVDPELAAFAASSAGKPMVLAPTVEVR
jgi:protease-4